jgi:hypothetical protein
MKKVISLNGVDDILTKQELKQRIENLEDRLDMIMETLCVFWSRVSMFTFSQEGIDIKFKEYEAKYIMPKKMK